MIDPLARTTDCLLKLGLMVLFGWALGCQSVRIPSREEQIIRHRRQALQTRQQQFVRSQQDFRRAITDAEERDLGATSQIAHWTSSIEQEQQTLNAIQEELDDLDHGIISDEAVRKWEYDRKYPERAQKQREARTRNPSLPPPTSTF